MKQETGKITLPQDFKSGSGNYRVVSKEIKDFLKFNGYTQTLLKMEQEETKTQQTKDDEIQTKVNNKKVDHSVGP
jgi:hypothetical protein